VGEDGKPVVYKKAKLGNSNQMYYNEEVGGNAGGFGGEPDLLQPTSCL
jgi:hypothetical protein